MSYFRKRPVLVQAVRFLMIDAEGKTQLNEEAPDWITAAGQLPPREKGSLMINPVNGKELLIHTLEGELIVSPGDWIIRGTSGELYPCKPDIFPTIYERASYAETK